MKSNIEFASSEDLSERQKNGLQKLREVVYPPEVIATLPGRFFTWAAPQWSVFVWEEDELVSRVGLLTREITHNRIEKHVGGIGGVMTHPQMQGQGLASEAMREAARLFDSELNVSFALLFCRPHLIKFYQRLEWRVFEGKVLVEQPEGKVEFAVNGPMLLDVREEAPLNGTLDLNGLPW